MLKYNRKKCTVETEGRIIKFKVGGLDRPSVITVKYMVGLVDYTIKETVKLKSEAIRVGSVPIGQRKTPRLGSVKEGTVVRVMYNPNKPEKAYLPDNIGIMNT